jgi:hypothetical protein
MQIVSENAQSDTTGAGTRNPSGWTQHRNNSMSIGGGSYARARLKLGVAGVGWIVTLTAIAFVYQLPSTFFPFYGGPWYADWAALGAFYLAYALISVPFDMIGGYVLPCRYHRLCLPFPVFLLKWMRGVVVQGVVMTLAGLAVLEAGKYAGYWGAVGVVAAIQIILLAAQAPLAAPASGGGVARDSSRLTGPRVFGWVLRTPGAGAPCAAAALANRPDAGRSRG